MKNKLLYLMFLLLCSCSSFLGAVLEKPQVDLEKVTIQDADLKGATLVFGVAVTNPNKVPIKVDNINYKIYVNEKQITQAVTEKPLSVPANSTGLVEIPMPLDYGKIFSDLKDLIVADSATYRIEGNAKVNVISIPFSKEGSIKLR